MKTKTVWKYQLDKSVGIPTVLDMPAGSSVLRVAFQGFDLCLWACVIPGKPIVVREFFISGTGHAVPMTAEYIDSVSQPPFEWHVWEKK
jgi:hypothetical protein